MMHDIVAFISKGKGLPAWFKSDLVMLGIGLHDLCKSVDYMCYKCEKIYGKEACKDIIILKEQVIEKVKEFNSLGMIAWRCVRDKREMDEDEEKIVKDYLEKNKMSIPEVLDPSYQLPSLGNE